MEFTDFQVVNGLMQGGLLSPTLFISVKEVFIGLSAWFCSVEVAYSWKMQRGGCDTIIKDLPT